ncbi:MAG: serine/threonine protein kinase [Myxococcales bacterium]|nr:serine/threonine protein kinase [Myxococcales bacterium]
MTRAIDPTAMRAQTRIGTVLREKWRLDALLGIGGMAAVYAATHRNGTRAAVKILHPELTTHSHVRSRFLKEGYVANRIEHSGAVKVIDDDAAEDGSLFLVMELLDGESLEDRRTRLGGTLDPDEVLAAADQLLDVLAAAHERGIVHRDIKPENVFLTRDGVVKVLDFGIARLRELSTASSATRTGTTMGTPAFMAPEHARGLWDEVDARSDLWSVGAAMFCMLTGRLVHEGRTTNELLLAAMTQPAPSLRSLAPTVPEVVAEVVNRALAFDKADRWPDARAMQDAVRRAYHRLHGAPLSTHPPIVVPAVVPNRTLPSAGVQLPELVGGPSTGPAVASGRTGVPLRSLAGVPQGVLVAVAAGALGLLVIVAVVTARFAASRSTATSTLASPVGSEPLPAAPPPPSAVDASLAPAAPSASAPGTPIVSLDDLPNAPAPKLAPGTKPAPPAPGAPPPAATPDWKEQRR